MGLNFAATKSSSCLTSGKRANKMQMQLTAVPHQARIDVQQRNRWSLPEAEAEAEPLPSI